MIDKKVMSELMKKLQITKAGVYLKIKKIQEECLCSREAAAYLLAAEVGLPVYDWVSGRELKWIRDLQGTRKIARVRPPQKQVIVKKETKIDQTTITPIKLYDLLNLHPRIIKASRSQFRSGHYTDAIFNALKCIEILVKAKSKSRGNGTDLMHKVFNENNPLIKLNELKEDYEIDEQKGFRFIYAGAMLGIRNPKAHAEIEQKDPYRTLEYLALASLLAKRLDEGIAVR